MGKSLFNGNIANATYAMNKLEHGSLNTNLVGYTYRYDQLNRLTATNFKVLETFQVDLSDATFHYWNNNDNTGAYGEAVTYDGNGNIKTYLRNGAGTSAMPLAMDNLTYGYNVNSQG